VQLGKDGWKARYYLEKMAGTAAHDVAWHYVRGLVWVLRYYYHGCCSWDWYFPFHYAPFPSDIAACLERTRDTRAMCAFTLGEPFRPFDQLMAVLPAASGHALPACLRAFMTEDSEIGDFYPADFPIDLNGKRFAWQAVILLPFIDVRFLAMPSFMLLGYLWVFYLKIVGRRRPGCCAWRGRRTRS